MSVLLVGNSIKIFFISILLMVCFCLPAKANPQDKPQEIHWINIYRQSENLKTLSKDKILSKTAFFYAKEIAENRYFAHKDKKGQRALDRYIANGGSEAIVGEILGIGPSPEEIIKSWKESYTHYQVIKDNRWTHFGEGNFKIEERVIYVILFTQKNANNLVLNWHYNNLWTLSGQWICPQTTPILYNGTKQQPPVIWQEDDGYFYFEIEASSLSPYLRLGYKNKDKGFIITHLFYPYRKNNSQP